MICKFLIRDYLTARVIVLINVLGRGYSLLGKYLFAATALEKVPVCLTPKILSRIAGLTVPFNITVPLTPTIGAFGFPDLA